MNNRHSHRTLEEKSLWEESQETLVTRVLHLRKRCDRLEREAAQQGGREEGAALALLRRTINTPNVLFHDSYLEGQIRDFFKNAASEDRHQHAIDETEGTHHAMRASSEARCHDCGEPLDGNGRCWGCDDSAPRAYEPAQPEAGKDEGKYKSLYMELLYAVSKKHPNEDRHQTALRYIQQSDGSRGQGSEAKSENRGTDR